MLVIQACQVFTNQQLPPVSSDARQGCAPEEEGKHIVLQRPHTLLLLSSITGGSAQRGLYTGALADQIARADGKTTIEEMQSRARVQMLQQHPDCSWQIPEMRSTLLKRLVLPESKKADNISADEPEAQPPKDNEE